jgi:biotin carboxyl carrier protein
MAGMTSDTGARPAAAPANSAPHDSPPTGTTPVADPRAVRAGVAPTNRAEGDPTITISRLSASDDPGDGHSPTGTTTPGILVDGELLGVHLEILDSEHAVLVEAGSPDAAVPTRTRVMLGAALRRASDGAALREVVIDGWRVEVELESERRASLRERARRGHEAAGKGGPVEIRAIIPGRIVAVSVGKGDEVVAGEQLLVLEAMKMQNELRAPREGRIEGIPVAVGDNVEVGDLLMVIT